MRQGGNAKVARLTGAVETLLIALADLASLVVIFELAVLVRTEALPRFYSGFPEFPTGASALSHWWVLLTWVFFIAYEGMYTRRFAFWDEVRAMCKASALATVGVFSIVFIAKLGGEVSRTVVFLMGMATLVAMPAQRYLVRKVLRGAGLLRHRVLVIGAGKTGRLIAEALTNEPNYGYEVVGFLDDDPAKQGTIIGGIKVHRGVDNADRYFAKCGIGSLVIAMPGAGRERVEGLINQYQHKVSSILMVPDIFGLAVLGTSLHHFFNEQAFALEVKNNLAQPLNYFTKRLFDHGVGLILAVLLMPVLLLIAMLIRLGSPGPAIYVHRRVGRNGREFGCYKFRTMYRDADERLKSILATDPEARREWEELYKLRDDPRITPVGMFLRKTSLDELPQIFNVLRGEMSLVGPRPVIQDEIDRYYKDAARLCFSVLPGITGLWQVSGRSDTGYAYRIALDSWYIRNWNLWLDIIIILRTLGVVFRRQGAY